MILVLFPCVSLWELFLMLELVTWILFLQRSIKCVHTATTEVHPNSGCL